MCVKFKVHSGMVFFSLQQRAQQWLLTETMPSSKGNWYNQFSNILLLIAITGHKSPWEQMTSADFIKIYSLSFSLKIDYFPQWRAALKIFGFAGCVWAEVISAERLKKPYKCGRQDQKQRARNTLSCLFQKVITNMQHCWLQLLWHCNA